MNAPRFFRRTRIFLFSLFAGIAVWMALPERRPDDADGMTSPDAQDFSPARPTPPPSGEPAKAEQNSTAQANERPTTSSHHTLPVKECADFLIWFEEYSAAPETRRAVLLSRGEAVAAARKGRMMELIRQDPERALANALRFDQIDALPISVRALVETPFSTPADYVALPVCPGTGRDRAPSSEALPAGELHFTTGHHVQVYVYGQRRSVGSKTGLPVQGIVLDELAALRDGVFQPLDKKELEAAEKQFPAAHLGPVRSFVTGALLLDEPVWALAAGKRYAFADTAELRELDQSLAALDAKPGPRAGSRALYALPYGTNGGTGFNLTEAQSLAAALSTEWTLTKKRVFLIRVDFSDKVGSPIEGVTAESLLNGQVNSALSAISYGNGGVEAKVSQRVYRLPKAAAVYSGTGTAGYGVGDFSSKNSDLLNDARAVFRAATRTGNDAGINIGTSSSDLGPDFDVVGVYFADIGCYGAGYRFAGYASIGGGDLWMQGNNEAKVYVHELGHVYGLGHANFWETNDGSVVGRGSEKEYGDIFDVMGDGSLPEGHFHPQAKQKLSWLKQEQWLDVSALGSKIYQVYPIDNADATRLVRGLRITKTPTQVTGGTETEYYWLGFRATNAAYPKLSSGAYLLWQRPDADKCCLLDTTPQTSGVKSDVAIDLGRTYADTTAGIYVTPVAVSGTGTGRHLDVQVHLGPFPNNREPLLLSLEGGTAAQARREITFSAVATDADGDTLAYRWDAGDGSVSGGTAAAAASFTHAWITEGTYTLKVTVSDMKGGSANRSVAVKVKDPARDFAKRTSGTDSDLFGIAASDTLLVAVGESTSGKGDDCVIRTSPDGIHWTKRPVTETVLNLKLRAVIWTGTRFVAVGTNFNQTNQEWYGVVYTSEDGVSWSLSYADSLLNTGLNVVAAGDGVVLAGGDGGTLLRSKDGQTFTRISGPAGLDSTQTVSGLAFGSGKFLLASHLRNSAVDSGKPILAQSVDGGVSWASLVAGSGLDSSQDFRALVYLNNRFVASGWYSKLRTSTDGGLTFTTTRENEEQAIFIAHGRGLFFAAGEQLPPAGSGGLPKPVHLFSMDGITWGRAEVPADVKQLNAGVFFNSRLVTVGEAGQILQTAPVGVESNRDPVIQSVSVQSGKKSRAPVSFGVTATDADGDSLSYFWDAGQGTVANTAQGFTHTWTAGGTYALSVTVNDGRGGSAKHTEWVTVTDSLGQPVLRGGSLLGNVNGLASSGSVAVAVGETTMQGVDAGTLTVVQTSTDGGMWTSRALPEWSANVKLRSVTWTGSRFVTVGEDYDQTAEEWRSVIYASNNSGSAWQRKYKSSVADSGLRTVRAGNGVLMAGGKNGALLRSTDGGENWSTVTPPATLLPSSHTVSGIAYGDSTFVLVAYIDTSVNYNGAARILTSPDGLNWSDQSAGTGISPWQDFRSIDFLGGRFVASGFYSQLRFSTNKGATFVPQKPDYEEVPALAYGNNVYFGAGVLMELGGSSSTGTNITLLSTDGEQWVSTPAPSGAKKALSAVFFKNSFLVGREDGQIWQNIPDSAEGAAVEILTQPAAATVLRDQPAKLEVFAAGVGTLSYQWFKNGVSISQATSASYLLASAKATDAGTYTVKISSSAGGGTVESAPAVLKVWDPVRIEAHPVGGTIGKGESLTLQVGATGGGNLTYQWRRNGQTIDNAIFPSLQISSSSPLNGGSYEVTVSNPVSSAASVPAKVEVDLSPKIAMPPAGQSLLSGASLLLKVTASGDGPLRYQWFKDGALIPLAVSAEYSVAAVGQTDTGTYGVRISNDYGQILSSSVQVTVSLPTGFAVLRQPPSQINFIEGSRSTIRLRVVPGAGETSYALVPVGNSPALAVVQGKVSPETGEALVVLNALNASGTYKVRFTRISPEGDAQTADSATFSLAKRSWEDAAGTYETLLAGETALEVAPAEPGSYRGMLVLSVTKRGAFSGKLLYNEAAALTSDGSSTLAPGTPRIYTPVQRSFSGSWSDDPQNPSIKVASPRLGMGSTASRQAMFLELDLSADPAVVNVRVSDTVSKGGGLFGSYAIGCVRLVTGSSSSLEPASVAGLTGRYTLGSDPGSPEEGYRPDTYTLVQVLPSLRALWATRMAGYTGTGSSGVQIADPNRPLVQFYEKFLLNTTTLFSSNSLLGELAFQRGSEPEWKAFFGSTLVPSGLERQTSCLNKRTTAPTAPIYDAAFETGGRWSRVERTGFLQGEGSRWSGLKSSGLPSFFPATLTRTLKLRDVLTSGGTTSTVDYLWTLNVSATGIVRVTSPTGPSSPLLRLRLDKLRGEWTGSFSTGANVRRNLYGASIDSASDSTVFGRGWAEPMTGTQKAPTGGWRLEE
jgi:hypothetical protein